MPPGLDYSSIIQDPDSIPAEDDKPDKKKKKKKGKSESESEGEEKPTTVSSAPGGDAVKKPVPMARPVPRAFKGTIVLKVEKPIIGINGLPVGKEVVDNLMHFQNRQKQGNIDVWWLYDDGGLTLLIPYILNTRTMFSDCRLRVFSICTNKEELDQEQRNLAALLSKFRISYSDVIVLPDIMKKAQTSTKIEFERLIQDFRVRDDQVTPENADCVITDTELETLKERTNRHMRLRELLKEHSSDATFVVMTLPIPRKGTVSAPLYMAWLELLTKGMPPYLLVRGNQSSVLTFYS